MTETENVLPDDEHPPYALVYYPGAQVAHYAPSTDSVYTLCGISYGRGFLGGSRVERDVARSLLVCPECQNAPQWRDILS